MTTRIYINLSIHISKYGSNTNHPTHTCTSIQEYIISIEAPKNFSTDIHSCYNIIVKIIIVFLRPIQIFFIITTTLVLSSNTKWGFHHSIPPCAIIAMILRSKPKHKKGKYTNSNKLNITSTQSAPNNLYATKNNSNLYHSYSVEPLSVLNHSYSVESCIYNHVEN